MKEYMEFTQKDKDTFKSVGNKLLRQCFICKSKDYYDYLFVVKNADFINEYFQPLGYQVRINTEYGVVQLVNKYNHNHMKFTAVETIILIILRDLYEEECKKLTQDDGIVVKLDEIHEKFISLKIQEKIINKGDLKKALNTAKRFNLINVIDSNLNSEDARIELLPSIMMLITIDMLNEVVNRINSLNGKEGDELDEVIEES